ncbi:ACP S-malonyltransferase [Nocardiopsis kunsanensis]|nr:ACP S-malonyltransferase [Nocardiopsis kunsanensis]
MFSGQGSHYYGMGRELRSSHPVFASALERLDGVFAGAGLPGVLEEIHRDDRTAVDPFSRLEYTHPAILMIELAMAETLRAEGIEPDLLLGASLGEFAAATVSGSITEEELAAAVSEQVRLVTTHCPPGGMTAILEDVETLKRDLLPGADVEIAAVNSPRHLVVSGADEPLERLERELAARRIVHQRLAVDYAFHSAGMDAAAPDYLRSLSGLPMRTPRIPVVSCESAGQLTRFEPGHLWRMVRDPVRFRDTIRDLEHEGGPFHCLDLGPSGTLAGFARQNLSEDSRSEATTILDPFAPSGRDRKRIGELRPGVPAHRSHSPQRGQRMTAILFPGQGSQKRGMGRDLFPDFPELVAQADEILGYSIERLCVDDPGKELDDTRFTQPALFVVGALSHLRRERSGAPAPDYFAGHSLGEYTALFAAGAFDFGTGLRLVQRRGELMSRMRDGAMAAVIGLSEDGVRSVLETADAQGVELANHNSPEQIIVSGDRTAVEGAKQAFTDAGARAYLPLKTSGAFHSRLMGPASREFARFLDEVEFTPPHTPVMANVTARPHVHGDLRRSLTQQLVEPVLWAQTVRYLLDLGETDFEELGPGRVLTGLVDKIRETHREAGTERSRTTVPPAPADTGPGGRLTARTLGSETFRRAYGAKYSYVCGSMYRGIASEELVVRASRAGILAFFGTGGLDRGRIERALRSIRSRVGEGAPFGMNLVHDPTLPSVEEETVDLFLEHGVDIVEASAFMRITPALARYRIKGLRSWNGRVEPGNRIIAKVSRPEVAEAFFSPLPERMVRRLVEQGLVSEEQAALASRVPVADDVCVEADSGGHTDGGHLSVLLPAIRSMRDTSHGEHGYDRPVGVGAAGGIGTPEAAATAFLLGADFVLTGSINLCTVEAGMSEPVKTMLEAIEVQDTDYAPAGDMFELGAQVQVLKKGVFFPARARKLHELYRSHESLDEIDPEMRSRIETRYFGRTFEEVWKETEAYFLERDPEEVRKAEQNPKHKMALVFRWYFGHSQRAAMEGDDSCRVDYQVHCGPALGAFNQWIRDTPQRSWRERHVDEIGVRLMTETAAYLQRRMSVLLGEERY